MFCASVEVSAVLLALLVLETSLLSDVALVVLVVQISAVPRKSVLEPMPKLVWIWQISCLDGSRF